MTDNGQILPLIVIKDTTIYPHNEVCSLWLLDLMCYLTLLVKYEAVGVVFIDLFSEVCCKSRQDFNFLFAAKNCQIEFLFSIAF